MTDSPHCPWCPTQPNTPEHLLLHCPRHRHSHCMGRMQLLVGSTLAASQRLCFTPGLVLSCWSLNSFHVSTTDPEKLFHEDSIG
ncbi:hypothetical protein E2C01_048129 [Portunus trituberculatus]|uniref:Uncharacterized protein n=1 Tax=Portunus trituberculatus TaxID=210409 RepID=A0A5B7G2V9_PORTR|nr:hypothetical protein [Portunus trituberculatus]